MPISTLLYQFSSSRMKKVIVNYFFKKKKKKKPQKLQARLLAVAVKFTRMTRTFRRRRPSNALNLSMKS
jgi:hypothetical protein